MVSMAAQATRPFDFLREAFDADQRTPEASVADSVFTTLRQAIVTMALRPGVRLTEQELADALDISRQPVREALLRLREAHLVRVAPRGSFVARISVADVETARFVREAIEIAIVRRAADGVAAHDAELMRDNLRRQERVAAAADADGFFMLDEEFHRMLATAAGCGEAWRIIEMAKAHMDRVRYLALPEATPMERLIAQHRTLLEAVARRDSDAAADAMQIHLREIIASLPLLAKLHPTLFDGAAPSQQRGPRPLRPGIVGAIDSTS